MSEPTTERKIFSLAEVTRSISKTIADRYKSNYWIKAEMNKLNFYSHSGHCYPDLVEKKNGKVIAEMRATLWGDDYRRIQSNFLKILKEPLKDGINILFCGNISFDPVYGISLRIIDIDPSFTLGDLEREKLETIARLKEEDLFSTGKRLPFPLLPQRIAVISVETSKGYADFLNMIDHNPWNYSFFHLLFPALLQGEKAIDSIISQLQRIAIVKHHFDIVVIVRGGGGDVGLSCYNNYNLAREIATFPIPVLTGIGHSTNETVAEMIAFRNAITPTALAGILIQRFHEFAQPVERSRELIVNRTNRYLLQEKNKLFDTIKRVKSGSGSLIMNHRYPLNQLLIQMKSAIKTQVAENMALLSNMEHKTFAMNPVNVMKRGYSITLVDGKLLTDVNEARAGGSITTLVANGKVMSEVKSIEEN